VRKIINIGMAFCGKEVELQYQIEDLGDSEDRLKAPL